jgi:hypothetical protein
MELELSCSHPPGARMRVALPTPTAALHTQARGSHLTEKPTSPAQPLTGCRSLLWPFFLSPLGGEMSPL